MAPPSILCLVRDKDLLLSFFTLQILSPWYNHTSLFLSALASTSLVGVSCNLNTPNGALCLSTALLQPDSGPHCHQLVIFQLQRAGCLSLPPQESPHRPWCLRKRVHQASLQAPQLPSRLLFPYTEATPPQARPQPLADCSLYQEVPFLLISGWKSIGFNSLVLGDVSLKTRLFTPVSLML